MEGGEKRRGCQRTFALAKDPLGMPQSLLAIHYHGLAKPPCTGTALSHFNLYDKAELKTLILNIQLYAKKIGVLPGKGKNKIEH